MNIVGIDTSYMTFALSIPVFGQIVMGAILAVVGISIDTEKIGSKSEFHPKNRGGDLP